MITALQSAPNYFEISDAPVYGPDDFIGFLLIAGFFGLQIAAGYLLWKAYVVGSPSLLRGVSVLGLNDDTSHTPTCSEPAHECEPPADLPIWPVVMYLVAGLATFSLGVLAFEAVHLFI